MPGGPDLTPDLALEQLTEMSADIRAAVLLDSRGRLAASGGEASDFEQMGKLTAQLLEQAREAADEDAKQLEVAVPGGTVYALTEGKWTVAVIASRSALSSLMFYDLRSVLSLLEARKAA
jgi:hypothetical protein